METEIKNPSRKNCLHTKVNRIRNCSRYLSFREFPVQRQPSTKNSLIFHYVSGLSFFYNISIILLKIFIFFVYFDVIRWSVMSVKIILHQFFFLKIHLLFQNKKNTKKNVKTHRNNNNKIIQNKTKSRWKMISI